MQPLLLNKDHFGQIAERLRIRLDLANFKCKHGYQNMDFYTIESVFRPNTIPVIPARKGAGKLREGYHHYYPIHNDNQYKKHKNQQSPTRVSSPTKTSGTTIPTFLQSPPLSAKRSTSPSRTDELTAQLLLWMCHSSGNA